MKKSNYFRKFIIFSSDKTYGCSPCLQNQRHVMKVLYKEGLSNFLVAELFHCILLNYAEADRDYSYSEVGMSRLHIDIGLRQCLKT